MIEEPNAGLDGSFARTINIERRANAGFPGIPPDLSAPLLHAAGFNQMNLQKTKLKQR